LIGWTVDDYIKAGETPEDARNLAAFRSNKHTGVTKVVDIADTRRWFITSIWDECCCVIGKTNYRHCRAFHEMFFDNIPLCDNYVKTDEDLNAFILVERMSPLDVPDSDRHLFSHFVIQFDTQKAFTDFQSREGEKILNVKCGTVDQNQGHTIEDLWYCRQDGIVPPQKGPPGGAHFHPFESWTAQEKHATSGRQRHKSGKYAIYIEHFDKPWEEVSAVKSILARHTSRTDHKFVRYQELVQELRRIKQDQRMAQNALKPQGPSRSPQIEVIKDESIAIRDTQIAISDMITKARNTAQPMPKIAVIAATVTVSTSTEDKLVFISKLATGIEQTIEAQHAWNDLQSQFLPHLDSPWTKAFSDPTSTLPRECFLTNVSAVVASAIIAELSKQSEIMLREFEARVTLSKSRQKPEGGPLMSKHTRVMTYREQADAPGLHVNAGSDLVAAWDAVDNFADQVDAPVFHPATCAAPSQLSQ
jgi:hypothetical protein